jgi:hypothetical protein
MVKIGSMINIMIVTGTKRSVNGGRNGVAMIGDMSAETMTETNAGEVTIGLHVTTDRAWNSGLINQSQN